LQIATANINVDAAIADLRLTGGILNITAGKTLTVTGSAIEVASSASTLSGSWRIAGDVRIGDEGTLSPGQGPGTLTVDAVDWGAGGKYRWEIAKALGQAGMDWDLVHLIDGLGISASADNPFEIGLVSLGADGAAGLLGDFDPTQSYSWMIASADKSLGFSPDAFRIDASQFANELAGGRFAIAQSGQDIVLTFTPVPEPALIMLPALAVLMVRRPRRWMLTASRFRLAKHTLESLSIGRKVLQVVAEGHSFAPQPSLGLPAVLQTQQSLKLISAQLACPIALNGHRFQRRPLQVLAKSGSQDILALSRKFNRDDHISPPATIIRKPVATFTQRHNLARMMNCDGCS